MHKRAKQSMILFVVLTLVAVPLGGAALAQEPGILDEKSGDAMAADLLLVRPVGIAASLLGSVFFIVSLPFSAMGGNTEEAYQKLVADPARHTFKRPLGEF